MKDTEENLDILESIDKNREIEIQNLKNELELSEAKLKALPIHSCDQCDFKSASNKGLKIHVGKMHETECPECNEIFAGEAKLKNTYVQSSCY